MSKGFQSAALIWWFIIPPAIVLSGLMAHFSSLIPFEQLGFVGTMFLYVLQHFRWFVVTGFWATIVAHLYEANLARKICQKLRIDATSTHLWTIQTFILGFPSLRILKEYLRQQK